MRVAIEHDCTPRRGPTGRARTWCVRQDQRLDAEPGHIADLDDLRRVPALRFNPELSASTSR